MSQAVAGHPARAGNIRWLMVMLVFLVATVSYLDRSNISIAAPVMKRDLGITDVQLGGVFSAFVFGYAFAQPLAGRMADRFGPYLVMAVGLFWWSALTSATAIIPAGFSQALLTLVAARFILGIGEAVIFPAGNRLVAGWIPAREQGLANGLIFAGVGAGAAIAPILMTSIMIESSWRVAFHVCAAIGLAVMVIWLLLAREKPDQHPWARPAELALIQADPLTQATAKARTLVPWRTIVSDRQVLLLSLSYFCFGYVAWIFFTWFFTYLLSVRGLDLKSSGIYGTLPFIGMAIASPLGGFISDRLVGRVGKRAARCGPAALGMGLGAIFLALAMQVQDARLAAVVLACGSGSMYLAQSAFWTLSADLGRSSAGAVSGVMNMCCQLGGALVAAVTPVIALSYGWSAPFLVAAAASLVGAITWLFIDPETTLGRRPASASVAAAAE